MTRGDKRCQGVTRDIFMMSRNFLDIISALYLLKNTLYLLKNRPKFFLPPSHPNLCVCVCVGGGGGGGGERGGKERRRDTVFTLSVHICPSVTFWWFLPLNLLNDLRILSYFA